MRNNQSPPYTEEVYFTPQYKIDAITSKYGLKTNDEHATSENIFEAAKGSTSITSHEYYVESDDYVLPPQDRNDIPEARPRKAEKEKERDMQDENLYTLARNSGFGKDFRISVVSDPSESKNKPDKKKLKCTHMIIICLIIAVLGIGGALAYILIDRVVPTMVESSTLPSTNDVPADTTKNGNYGNQNVCISWRDDESNSTIQLPDDIAPGCTSDRISVSVTFADGTYGEATYLGLTGKWDSGFSGVRPSNGRGFLSGCNLVGLTHRYTNGLPLAWINCQMKYSDNFDLDKNISRGGNFRASASGWNYADFNICCG